MTMEAAADQQSWDQDRRHSHDWLSYSSSPVSRQARRPHLSQVPWEHLPQGASSDPYIRNEDLYTGDNDGQFDLDGSAPSLHRMDIVRVVELLEITTDSPSATPPTSAAPGLTGPVQLLNKILKSWRLDEADAISLLGLEPSDQEYAADVLAGRTALRGRDAKDRLAYLIQIRTTLAAWLRSEAVENDWLREPHEPLDGKVPMELLLEGSMENLLLVKEYLEAAKGW